MARVLSSFFLLRFSYFKPPYLGNSTSYSQRDQSPQKASRRYAHLIIVYKVWSQPEAIYFFQQNFPFFDGLKIYFIVRSIMLFLRPTDVLLLDEFWLTEAGQVDFDVHHTGSRLEGVFQSSSCCVGLMRVLSMDCASVRGWHSRWTHRDTSNNRNSLKTTSHTPQTALKRHLQQWVE